MPYNEILILEFELKIGCMNIYEIACIILFWLNEAFQSSTGIWGYLFCQIHDFVVHSFEKTIRMYEQKL